METFVDRLTREFESFKDAAVANLNLRRPPDAKEGTNNSVDKADTFRNWDNFGNWGNFASWYQFDDLNP